jgi:hypothetical protein
VRRWRSIEEWSSSEGALTGGANGGDARMESGAEEGLRWWKIGEVDAWEMGSVCGTRAWTGEAEGWAPLKLRSLGAEIFLSPEGYGKSDLPNRSRCRARDYTM